MVESSAVLKCQSKLTRIRFLCNTSAATSAVDPSLVLYTLLRPLTAQTGKLFKFQTLNETLISISINSRSSAAQLSIRAGSSNRLSGGIVVNVAGINQHPSYDDWLIDYDISVLVLSSTLSVGPGIGPIGLPAQSQYIPAGVDSRITGWGTLYEGAGSLPTYLQGVTVPTVSLAECRDAYGASLVTDRMMCAGVPQGGLDACQVRNINDVFPFKFDFDTGDLFQGDSGGPLVIGTELIGIVSWGYGCARAGFPGVYASVPALRNFILQSVGV